MIWRQDWCSVRLRLTKGSGEDSKRSKRGVAMMISTLNSSEGHWLFIGKISKWYLWNTTWSGRKLSNTELVRIFFSLLFVQIEWSSRQINGDILFSCVKVLKYRMQMIHGQKNRFYVVIIIVQTGLVVMLNVNEVLNFFLLRWFVL